MAALNQLQHLHDPFKNSQLQQILSILATSLPFPRPTNPHPLDHPPSAPALALAVTLRLHTQQHPTP